jgi:hypothetical protein
MRRLILLILFFQSAVQAYTQNQNNTLDVVSWNIAWFGHTVQYPPDDNLQEENVKKVLRHLDADLYGLTEIVDTNRLRRVTDSLGAHFDFIIAPFCSGNTTGTGNTWLTCQKLAFIYNKNIFTNIRSRGMMRNSATAYYNYASGRFPYLMSADVTINGVTKAMNFILIHGKAGSTVSDYERRRDGAKELKDTLDAQFANTTNIIIGDYNDALDRTICTSCPTTLSSFDPIIKDSTDGDHYVSITLPLAVAGQTSMTNYPNLVDNHVISNEATAAYIPNSAAVRTEVASLVVQYGATTSDHYPVISRYVINNIITSLPTGINVLNEVSVFPNPVRDMVHVLPGKNLHEVTIQITDIQGRIIFSSYYKRLSASQVLVIPANKIQKGILLLNIYTREGKKVLKLVKA